MIAIDDCLFSEELFEKKFVCDLQACKGACCIEGESGAPLEEEELEKLDEVYDAVKPYLRKEGIEAIEKVGLFEIDQDGDYVTPLVNGAECAYVVFDDAGITKCGIEQAYREGKTQWKKPISCHLYPIRTKQLKDFMALNYHYWPICDPACDLGKHLKVPVFRFLKEPLERKFSSEFYQQMELAYELWLKQDEKV